MERLKDNLNEQNDNYILPLFWQHGEEASELCHYLEMIEKSGIHAVCVESRPHPDFLGDTWWRSMDAIIKEAKKRKMKVWLMDDSHFPTGYASGAIERSYPHLRKRFLKLHQIDFFGPERYAEAIIKYAFSDETDALVGVYIAKKIDGDTIDPDTLLDITSGVTGKKSVSFNLPEGEWRLLILVSTFFGGEQQTDNYLNPIDPVATDVLINTVYEPHYERYQMHFGDTFAGFFSDEPRFGNIHGAIGSIGRVDMVLPWREDMISLLDKELGHSSAIYLPLLFVDGGDLAHAMRYHYMNLVSDLYSTHFNKRIADWCKNHGTEYIGHTIEDNNSHARLGYGAGHFYKAMAHQDMAGIDVVLHQLMPGMDQHMNKAMTKNGWDGEFFHYCLAKLGSSLGHMDPNKKGRTMCEVFGAYGWAEGNRMMKWIQDHMLVRGVNVFAPHAFNPNDYPDPDCPPHFYAHGKNPQFENFKMVMDYTNRMSHLLTGGIHRAPVVISYHGEAEWAGDYMLTQKPAAILTKNQIDFDILPIDAITEAQIDNQMFKVNRESFQALVIPYAEALPIKYLETILKLADANVPIYFIDALPDRESTGRSIQALLNSIKTHLNIKTALLSELPELLDSIRDVSIENYTPYLRYYHYEQNDGNMYLFVNEHPTNAIKTKIKTAIKGQSYWYDAMLNKLSSAENLNNTMDGVLDLSLAPYESIVLVYPSEKDQLNEPFINARSKMLFKNCISTKLQGPYVVSFAKSETPTEFKDERTLASLEPIQNMEDKADFTGIIRYEMSYYEELSNHDLSLELILNGVYESAKVYVNEVKCGTRICPPYKYDISSMVNQGLNKIVIETTTTLVRAHYDWLSQYMLLEPTGITQDIIINKSFI